jgi:sensor histidine kinase YesM
MSLRARVVTFEAADGSAEATVYVPTALPPSYVLRLASLSGGRRLLSDDIAMLEGVAEILGRRIDAVRLTQDRFEQAIRSKEMQQLATEAELRALRAQLNPHFLFNALTTIGYLTQTAPARAIETLYRLTGLLRAVLRRSDREFTTLGEELEIVESYLSIERARFEHRLVERIEVDEALRAARVPPLVIQPLVENAVKHGISKQRHGGTVSVIARLEGDGSAARLRITVADTGMGATANELAAGRRGGIGLSNLERRLERYYGPRAAFTIRSAAGKGTTVELVLPAEGLDEQRTEPAQASARAPHTAGRPVHAGGE